MLEKFELYHSTISWFAKKSEIHNSSRSEALFIICQKVSQILNVGRVSIWLYSKDRTFMSSELILQDNKTLNGHILNKEDFPIYFSHLEEERVVVSTNTLEDSVTKEFVESYMKPFNIKALLDAPIFSDGKMIGILCCENLEVTRDWDILDRNFVASCADFIARIMESEKRHRYESELRHRISYLEIDLKKKLEDLNEAKLSLDMALESAQVGKWDWNLKTDVVKLNKTWFTKLGYDPNEMPQHLSTFKKVLHPDDLPHVLEDLQNHLEGKTAIYESRYRMISKTGETQWCLDRGSIIRDSNGDALRVIGVNVNVTPFIKLEQSLILSEQQLKAMIESLPTPVAMFDKNFEYLAYSQRWEQEWKTYDDLMNFQQEGISNQEFRVSWHQKMKKALDGAVLSKDEDLISITPDNQIWMRWVMQPWKIATGEIGGIIVMAENITHRKEAEMRIAQSSKLSALGEMAGGIAHEINNPLSIIKGYIDLLKRHSSRHTLNEELMLQYINKMDQTVGRISRIVNGMRRFSRESSMDEKVEYSLNKIIEETLDICLERINNNGTAINVQYFKDSPLVYCRPIEISQVLLNLINNAYQAVANFQHPWINIRCEEAGDNYKISVTDSGSGIPFMIRQKLFQPFFTTKDIGVGTGLGLSISRGIVEEHQGKLYYQDDSHNTTFVIEIPKLFKTEQLTT